jgi:hypothetical protein
MFPLVRQVQIAVDFAKGVSSRLAEVEVPKYDDTETTFAELQALIAKVLAYIGEIKPEQINGKEGIEIVTRPGTPKEKRFSGQAYLLSYGCRSSSSTSPPLTPCCVTTVWKWASATTWARSKHPVQKPARFTPWRAFYVRACGSSCFVAAGGPFASSPGKPPP